jgi:hypothetical protein
VHGVEHRTMARGSEEGGVLEARQQLQLGPGAGCAILPIDLQPPAARRALAGGAAAGANRPNQFTRS